MRTLNITVDIAVEPDAVMAFAADPRNLPRWAPGFARGIAPESDEWVVQTEQGPVRLWFTPPNADGILDHVVRLPNGDEIMNTMRVLAHATGSTVSFVLHQHAGMSEAQFAQDAELVRADLLNLKALLED